MQAEAMMNDAMMTYSLPSSGDGVEVEECTDMASSVRAVERLLQYPFRKKKLLEDALTHSSYTESTSYQRLEFVGDAALGLALTNYVYLAYPDVEPGELSLLRAANVSTEKLARVAVRHGLYRYVRHNTVALDEKVKDFVMLVQQETETMGVYGGTMKAPKVLADIVESVAAAVYIDCGFNLERLWVIFRALLEPIITLDLLHRQPHPLTMLFESCQKEGKQLDIKHWKKEDKNIASVYIDGELIVSCSSEQKENAKLQAAKAALEKLPYKVSDKMCIDLELDENNDSQSAKQKLNEHCRKKKWPKPTYRNEGATGPAHDRRFICSVEIATVDSVYAKSGDEKSRVRDAENSAASKMLRSLRESGLI